MRVTTIKEKQAVIIEKDLAIKLENGKIIIYRPEVSHG